MADAPKKEPTDAEIAAKTGFGETAEEAEAAQEEATESDEETEETETEEETESSNAKAAEESEEEVAEKPAARQKREVSKSDESDDAEESEETSDEDEPKEEADDDATNKEKNRTVPYSLLKAKNQKIKSLEADLADARSKKEAAEESGDDDAADEAADEIEATAKSLGEELGLDEKGVSKILKAAVKLSSKNSVLPKDIADKLKKLDALEAKDKASEELAHFNTEWDGLDVKKQFPTASKSQLVEAKELMDKLAHSKEFHKYDLDYILFKNKAKFDTILKIAPKSKSGEAGKRIGKEKTDEGDEEESLVDIENLTPDIMREREAKEKQMRRDHMNDKDYIIHKPSRGE